MKSDGQSYANYIENIIEDHRTKNIKSICSFILQNSCKNLAGFTNFLLNYLFELMELNLNQINCFEKFTTLRQDDIIFKLNVCNEYQIDLVFFIYCILTDKIIKNKNYM
jgi:hypothetical protein